MGKATGMNRVIKTIYVYKHAVIKITEMNNIKRDTREMKRSGKFMNYSCILWVDDDV